jgi:hypothetical protein
MFGSYWYSGDAEITSYRLSQWRYGELREGTAVLIYVTEDFSRSKQVKLDVPSEAGDDAVKVLKLNLTKDFTTGIYPYSMMQSVFTPVDLAANPRTLKTTTSSQEWCGHTFTQLNLAGDEYRARLYSYFESESDQDLVISPDFLEDEIWTRLRLNPAGLPVGTFSILPGSLYQRFSHDKIIPLEAVGSIAESEDGTSVYRLEYPTLERSLSIRYSSAFPFEILGWEETIRTGSEESSRTLTTRAERDNSLKIDYWNRNSNSDLPLRDALNL